MSKCPVAHLWMNKDGKEEERSSKDHQQGTSISHQSSCPVLDGEKRIEELHVDEGTVTMPNRGGMASCPLGFGRSGGAGPAMSQLHCVICKSLMYHASVTNCGHRFCRECIEKCRDCPVCGADVVKVEPDEATERMVEQFIDAHAGHVSFWELEEGGRMDALSVQSGEPSLEESREKARFLLQAGIRALTGGNEVNAKHRFLQCVDVLKWAISSAESKGEGDGYGWLQQLESQLGAVYGCIGDCERRHGHEDGEGNEVMTWYEQSVEALERAVKHADDSNNGNAIDTATGTNILQLHNKNEVMHSLSITLNKMGELYHGQGNMEQAAGLYSRALEIREACLNEYRDHVGENAREPEIEVALVLDVVISQVKVADALRSLGDETDDADRLIANAKRLMQTGVCGKMHECRSASSHDKFSKLQHYLGI